MVVNINPWSVGILAAVLLLRLASAKQRRHAQELLPPGWDWKEDKKNPEDPLKKTVTITGKDFLDWIKKNPFWVKEEFKGIQELLLLCEKTLNASEASIISALGVGWLTELFPNDPYRQKL